MNKIYRILTTTNTSKYFFALLILQLIIGIGIVVNVIKLLELSDGRIIIDFLVGYSAEDIKTTLASYGTKGMAIYKDILFMDVLNPAIYGLVVANLLYLFLKNTKHQYLVIVPFIVSILDYIENVFIFIFLKDYPMISDSLVGIASSVSIAKHSCMYAMFILLVGVGNVKLVKRTSEGIS